MSPRSAGISARKHAVTSRKRTPGIPRDVRRIGVFGGTFDPIHLGHLRCAEEAREQLGLDHVLFIPAADPPHKPHRRIIPAHHRLAMVKLAAAGTKSTRSSPSCSRASSAQRRCARWIGSNVPPKTPMRSGTGLRVRRRPADVAG